MKNICTECSTEITEAEYNYSLNRFERPLCREHQRLQDNLDNDVSENTCSMKMMSIKVPFLRKKASSLKI